jgi:hypothetical protein
MQGYLVSLIGLFSAYLYALMMSRANNAFEMNGDNIWLGFTSEVVGGRHRSENK